MRTNLTSGAALRRLMRLSTARPTITIALCLIIAAGSLLYTARTLTFETSSIQLLPPGRPYVRQFKANLKEFGELNDLVVVVEAPSPERAQAYADRLAAEIKALPGAGRVSHRVDPELFAGKALLYLSLDRLQDLRDKVLLHRQFIVDYAARPTLAGLLDGISDEISRRFAQGFIDLGLDAAGPERFDAGFVDTLLGVIGDGLDGRLVGSPWARVFSEADEEHSGYFMSADKKLLYVLVEPRREAANFTDNLEFLAGIRGAIGALHGDYPDVAAGVTGTPALSNDEMVTAFHDSTVATAIAFALTLLLLVVVFRRAVEPLVMVGVLVVSLAWSLAIISATIGHLTVFSVMFISLLVGVGIDYGIYLFYRYEEEIGQGRAPREALEATASRTGPGILFGALAAAATFGVLTLTEFRGVQEFGFVAGVSILMSFLAMMTLLPAALMVMQGRALRRLRSSPRPGGIGAEGAPALQRALRHPVAILAVAGTVSLYSLLAVPSVRLDYNRLSLQAKGNESVFWERKIMESRQSGFPALATAESLPELRSKRDAFERLPAVSEVRSVLTLIPSQQDEKIAVIRDLAPVVSRVRFREVPPSDPGAIRGALERLEGRLALAVREADPGPTLDTLRSAHDRVGKLRGRLAVARIDEVTRRLAPLQASLRDDFAAKLHRLQENATPTPITIDQLPVELSRKFIGRTGRFLMTIYPSIDTWERDGAQRFVEQIRSVDEAVTGSPVVSYEASRLMEEAYFHGTLYALVLVAALAFLMFRAVRAPLLSMVPLGLATLWTVGLMHVFGLSFNLANVWALPLIVGAAAEYGLNVMLRLREVAAAGGTVLPATTVMAVLLSGLTTVSGFGSLMVAHHQGIFGLGCLLTVGAATGLSSALVVLPALLRMLEPKVAVRQGATDPSRATNREGASC